MLLIRCLVNEMKGNVCASITFMGNISSVLMTSKLTSRLCQCCFIWCISKLSIIMLYFKDDWYELYRWKIIIKTVDFFIGNKQNWYYLKIFVFSYKAYHKLSGEMPHEGINLSNLTHLTLEIWMQFYLCNFWHISILLGISSALVFRWIPLCFIDDKWT